MGKTSGTFTPPLPRALSNTLMKISKSPQSPGSPGSERKKKNFFQVQIFFQAQVVFQVQIIFQAQILFQVQIFFSSTNIFPGANIFSWYKRDPLAKIKTVAKKQIRRQLFKYQFLKLISVDWSVRERWNEFGNQDKVVLGKAVLMHSFCCWAFKSDAWFFYIKNFF